MKCLLDFVERDSRFICSQCQSDRKTAVQERDEQEKTRRGDWSIFKIDYKKMLCILDTKRNNTCITLIIYPRKKFYSVPVVNSPEKCSKAIGKSCNILYKIKCLF